MTKLIYDVKAHAQELLANPTYLAHPAFTTSVGWKQVNGANILFRYGGEEEDADGPAAPYGYVTAAGIVLSTKCFVGAVGNWSNKFNQPITAAKYSLLIGRPDFDPALAAQWDKGMGSTNVVQGAVATGTPANWVVPDGNQSALRFTKKVFEKKGGECPSGVDITKWPVGTEYKDHLAAITNTHDVCLLPVYDIDETLVAPANIEKKLRGALVEITAKLVHYGFEKEGVSVDSFTADIQQIVIKRYGQAPPSTVFRRGARPIKFGSVAAVAASGLPSAFMNNAAAPTPPTGSPAPAPPGPTTIPVATTLESVSGSTLNTGVAGWSADGADGARGGGSGSKRKEMDSEGEKGSTPKKLKGTAGVVHA